MRHVFSNNAVTTLAVGITAIDTSITLTDDTAFSDITGDWGPIQALTITDPSNVLPPEIVYVVATPAVGERAVIRNRENTDPQVWPAGAIVSARVTANMLGSFLQMDESGGIHTPNETTPGKNWLGPGVVQLPGFQVLQPRRSDIGSTFGRLDANLGVEMVGTTVPVGLGAVPTWTSGALYDEDAVVLPPVSTGYQYCFEPMWQDGKSMTTTTPEFGAASCPALYDSDNVGFWTPVDTANLAVDLSTSAATGVLISEVGFICSAFSAGSAPVVSIGIVGEPTKYASSVSLSQVTAAYHVHRIPISTGGSVGAPLFTLVTPGSGTFTGRFYWRGVLLQ